MTAIATIGWNAEVAEEILKPRGRNFVFLYR